LIISICLLQERRGVNELEGKVAGVCISEKSGTGKINVGKGYLEKDRGLVGDAHAGTERQVSVLTLEVMEKVASEGGFSAAPGDFAENINIKGIDVDEIELGSCLLLGNAELEVVQIGKVIDETHTFNFHGKVPLVTEGRFCRVVRSGWVSIGDQVRLIKPN
jgi:MOSC domain-containing protein YiiM